MWLLPAVNAATGQVLSTQPAVDHGHHPATYDTYHWSYTAGIRPPSTTHDNQSPNWHSVQLFRRMNRKMTNVQLLAFFTLQPLSLDFTSHRRRGSIVRDRPSALSHYTQSRSTANCVYDTKVRRYTKDNRTESNYALVNPKPK